MKRVLFILVSVLCFSGVSYAQQTEKEIKQAMKDANAVLRNVKNQLESEDGNINVAKSLIIKAMDNEYTKSNPDTWELAGDIYKQLFSNESFKSSRMQAYDTVAMYDYLVKMYDYYNRCDSLQQIPNEKGKTSTSCRDRVASNLDGNRTEFINGGIFYFNHRRDYAKAYEIFSKYYEVCDMPMLKSYTENNPQYAEYSKQFAYFTTLSARMMEDYDKVLKYCDLGVEDEENGEQCYQFKCEAYQQLKDTVNWVKALQEGIVRYPTSDYYYMQLLVYYDNSGKMDEMEQFVNAMLEKDPDKSYNHYVKGYLFQQQKKYKDAIEAYKNALEKDPNLIEANINLGLCYMFDANDYMESKSNVKFNTPAYKEMIETEKTYYKNALPLFEKVRELAPDDVNKWGLQLYSIYYKLGMNKEMDQIETILKAEGMLD